MCPNTAHAFVPLKIAVVIAVLWHIHLARANDAPPAVDFANVHRIGVDRTEAVRKVYLEEARPVLQRYLSAGAGADPALWAQVQTVIAKLYAAGGADTPAIVKSFLKDSGPRGMSAPEGQLIWKVRNHWFFLAADNIARRKKVSLGFLDSGTEGSAANDTDKTARVLKQHDKRSKLTDAEVPKLMAEEMAAVIKAATGCDVPMAHLDIEVFSGENLYPAWWEATEPGVFKANAFAILKALQANPAAYVTEGALKMQVIRRAQEKAARLRAQGEKRGPGAAFMRIDPDVKTGAVTHSEPEDWLDMLHLCGELLPNQDAYGSSLGNTLMLLHKLAHGTTAAEIDAVKDDLAKYLTRNLLDTATVIVSPDANGELQRFDPSDFPDERSRKALLAEVCGVSLSDPQEARNIEGYLRAIEISQDLLHNKQLRANNQAGKAKSDEDVFRKLAVQVAGSETAYAKEPAKFQALAREAYARISAEASMRALTHNFPKVVHEWLKPDPALVDRAKRYNENFKNQNIRIMAMVLLKASYEGLPPEKWKALRAAAGDEHAVDLENLERMLRWGEPQHLPPPPEPFTPEERARFRQRAEADAQANRSAFDTLRKRFPLTTDDGRLFSITAEDIVRWHLHKAMQHLPVESYEKAVTSINGITRETGYRFNVKAAMRNVFDLGTADSALNLIQAYQQAEDQGPEAQRQALKHALANEAMCRVPGIGQIKMVYDAAHAEDNGTQLMEVVVPMLEEAAGGGAAGPVIFYVNFCKKTVAIVGHAVFHPLRRHYVDIVYKGYLDDSDRSILRNDKHVPTAYDPSAFRSLVSAVPVRFAVIQGELLDTLMHQLDQEGAGSSQAFIALVNQIKASDPQNPSVVVDVEAPYDRWVGEVREELADLAAHDTTDPIAQRQRDAIAGALTTVLKQWQAQALLARAVGARINPAAFATTYDPRLAFEVHRQNLYRHLGKFVDPIVAVHGDNGAGLVEVFADLEKEEADLRYAQANVRGTTIQQVEARRAELQKIQARLVQRRADLLDMQRKQTESVRSAAAEYAELYVKDWVQASGDFKDQDQNIALKWVYHDEETRHAIAARLADDYVASSLLTPAAEAHHRLLIQLKEMALQKAAESHARDIAVAAERAWGTLNADDAGVYAMAIPKTPDLKPRVQSRVDLIESRDENGRLCQDLQISGQATAVPDRYDGDWMLRPVFRRVDLEQLSQAQLATAGIPRERIAAAYAVGLDFVVGSSDAKALSSDTKLLFTAREGEEPVAGNLSRDGFSLISVAVKVFDESKAQIICKYFSGGEPLKLRMYDKSSNSWRDDPRPDGYNKEEQTNLPPKATMQIFNIGRDDHGVAQPFTMQFVNPRDNSIYAQRDVVVPGFQRVWILKGVRQVEGKTQYSDDQFSEKWKLDAQLDGGTVHLTGHTVEPKSGVWHHAEAWLGPMPAVIRSNQQLAIWFECVKNEQRIVESQGNRITRDEHIMRRTWFHEKLNCSFDGKAWGWVNSRYLNLLKPKDLEALNEMRKTIDLPAPRKDGGEGLVHTVAAFTYTPSSSINTPQILFRGNFGVAHSGDPDSEIRENLCFEWAYVQASPQEAAAAGASASAGGGNATAAGGAPDGGASATGMPQAPPGGAGVPPYVAASGNNNLPPYVRASGSPGGGQANPQPAASPPADPLAILKTPQPWENPVVAGLMDEWLRISTPDVRQRPGETRQFRWSSWGVCLAPGVVAAGPPDHGSMSRGEYLFTYAAKLPSRNHYTLREYLERRLRGESGIAHAPSAADRPGAAAPGATPGAAGPAAGAGQARAQVGSTVGCIAPDLQGQVADRAPFALSQQRGKVVVLMTWGIYDPSAVAAVQKLDRIRGAASADRLRPVLVPLDSLRIEHEAETWAKELGVDPGMCVDVRQDRFRDPFAVRVDDFSLTRPRALLVIDAQGIIRFRADDQAETAVGSPQFIKVMKELLPEANWPAALASAAAKK